MSKRTTSGLVPYLLSTTPRLSVSALHSYSIIRVRKWKPIHLSRHQRNGPFIPSHEWRRDFPGRRLRGEEAYGKTDLKRSVYLLSR